MLTKQIWGRIRKEEGDLDSDLVQKPVQKQVPPPVNTGALTVRPPKPSFFGRLFGNRKPKEKVGSMDVKKTGQSN